MAVIENDLKYIWDSLSQNELDRLRGSKILITGCAGFLGFYFMKFLSRYAAELNIKKVIALDNFMLGRPQWVKSIDSPAMHVQEFDIIKGDIKGLSGLEDIDFIIHMASIASPSFYRKYPLETLEANIWGLRRLLDLYSSKKIKGFLFFSSSEIYGDPTPEAIPTNEEYRGFVSCTGPRACYDESKRFGETICAIFAQKYNMPIGVARPFNNYGPGMRLGDRRVPADFAKAVVYNNDIVVLSSGQPTRTFCYIADAITGYFKVLIHGRYDYFNIGMDTPEISVMRLAEIYREAGAEIFGHGVKIAQGFSDDGDYLTHNPERRCPDLSKAKKILGYNPTIGVEEGVRRFLLFIQESDEGDYLW